jgi:hypothetical protein
MQVNIISSTTQMHPPRAHMHKITTPQNKCQSSTTTKATAFHKKHKIMTRKIMSTLAHIRSKPKMRHNTSSTTNTRTTNTHATKRSGFAKPQPPPQQNLGHASKAHPDDKIRN